MARNIVSVAPIMPGDTITYNGNLVDFGGFCTSSATTVVFTVPLPRPVVATKVQISEMYGSIRQGGDFRYGIENGGDILAQASSIACYMTPFGIDVILRFPSTATTGVSDNCPLNVVSSKITLKFS